MAPSQRLSNGLEEIHSQIKQTRWKKLKNNVHTDTLASRKLVLSPGNKQDSLFMYSLTAAPRYMVTTKLSKWVWMQSHSFDVL